MGRVPCRDKANVKRGPWSPEEDAALRSYVEEHHGTVSNWIAMPQKAGLRRCGKSCRLRWLNYLRPDIKHGCFTEEEDNIICTLYNNIGSRWSVIASHLPGRTDNDVKNYWNTKLKKKVVLVGSTISSSLMISKNSPNSAPIMPPPPTAPPLPPPPALTDFTATLDSGGCGSIEEEYLYRFLSELPDPFPMPSSPVTNMSTPPRDQEGSSASTISAGNWSAANGGCYKSSSTNHVLLSDLGTAGSYSTELPGDFAPFYYYYYYSSSSSNCGTKADQGLYQNVTYS